MPSVTASIVPGFHRPSVLRTKSLEKKLPRQHRKMRDSASQADGLPRLDPLSKSLAVELGRVREKEREKIAEDLHDHIGQNLALAKIKLGVLNSSVGNKHAALIAGISELISDTIQDTRSLIHELHPEWVSKASLKEAIDWVAAQTQARYSLPCDIEFAGVPKAIKEEVQEVLLQAVRELLVNTAKHARATRAKIICGSEKGWIQIAVVDDGRGFDPAKIFSSRPKVGSFGLMIIRARLGLLGGHLSIHSRAGAGTSAMIALPQSEINSFE